MATETRNFAFLVILQKEGRKKICENLNKGQGSGKIRAGT